MLIEANSSLIPKRTILVLFCYLVQHFCILTITTMHTKENNFVTMRFLWRGRRISLCVQLNEISSEFNTNFTHQMKLKNKEERSLDKRNALWYSNVLFQPWYIPVGVILALFLIGLIIVVFLLITRESRYYNV